MSALPRTIAVTEETTSQPAAARVNDVVAPLSFIVPQATKPILESAAITGGAPKMHFDMEQRPVRIRSMRPHEGEFSLDREGFALRRHASLVADFYDDRALQDIYDCEIQNLLVAATGADRVAVFDHTRRSDAPAGAKNRDGARGPANSVHVDYTVASGPKRAADVLGAEEFARITQSGGRVMQVNVWRPIKGPVLRSPLALADAGTVRPDQLIATDQVFPDRVGEIYHLAWGVGQRWYWAPEMDRDEVLLIKGWDSLDDGRARFTPHCAFQLPTEIPNAPPRESLEVRTFVVFER